MSELCTLREAVRRVQPRLGLPAATIAQLARSPEFGGLVKLNRRVHRVAPDALLAFIQAKLRPLSA